MRSLQTITHFQRPHWRDSQEITSIRTRSPYRKRKVSSNAHATREYKMCCKIQNVGPAISYRRRYWRLAVGFIVYLMFVRARCADRGRLFEPLSTGSAVGPEVSGRISGSPRSFLADPSRTPLTVCFEYYFAITGNKASLYIAFAEFYVFVCVSCEVFVCVYVRGLLCVCIGALHI